MRHSWWRWLILVVVIVAVFIPSQAWLSKRISQYKSDYRTPLNPIIMVPGSSASQDRFDTLITQLRQETKVPHSVLKVKVMEDGQLSYTGSIKRGDNQPFIVIAFENNRDGYSNIVKQAAWLDLAFKDLAKTYRFNHFSALGHSNGGLALSLFMEDYLPKIKSVTADKLMTIATPYNMETDSTTEQTPILKDLINGRKNLPKKLVVYSVAGSETYSSDGTVPANSVNQGKYVFQNQVAHYTQITVTGDNTTHSDLPQNRQIVLLIRQYILQEVLPAKDRYTPPTKQSRNASSDPGETGLP